MFQLFFQKYDQPITTKWDRSTWLLWSIFPILCLEFVLILGISYTQYFTPSNYASFQQSIFTLINHSLNVVPEFIWMNMTYLGDGVVIFALLSLLLLFRAQAWAAMFASIFFASIITNIGKKFFAMPRPAAILPHDQFIIIGEVLEGKNSLPSGHSITITFVLVSIMLTFLSHPKNVKQVICILGFMLAIFLFCFSRVAVGAHWPLDVIAGVGCGWLAALVGVMLAREYHCWWQYFLVGKARFILVGLLMILTISLMLRSFHEIQAMPILLLSSFVSLFVAIMLFLKKDNLSNFNFK